MSLIGILSFLLFLKEVDGGYTFGLNPKIFRPPPLSRWWPFTGFLFFFFWIILSVFWSGGEFNSWFSDVQSKLSIIGIAVIFGLFPKLGNDRIVILHQVFGGTIFVAMLLVLYVYIPAYEDITLRIGRGRPIPTPIDHVRFSLMVAYACLSFAVLFFEGKRFGLRPKEKATMAFLSVVFFVFCHVLAVRTGLILLYLGIIGLIFYIVLSKKKYLVGGLLLLAVASLPLIAYFSVESFRNKVYYTKYDIQQMLSNNGENYSDGDRIRSIQEGIELWKQHPIIGLGGGEYKKAMIDFHEKNKVGGKSLLPHNQFIRAGMAYGWIGMILLLSGFGFILARRKTWSNFPLLLIVGLLFVSLLVESNLERYYALAFFMLFLGINSHIEEDENEIST